MSKYYPFGEDEFEERIDDAEVNDILIGIVCEEFVIQDIASVTTAQVANMLVNAKVSNVFIKCCNRVNVRELRNQYPNITFTHFEELNKAEVDNAFTIFSYNLDDF